jgi:Flp pilus assembly protein TadG
MMAGRRRDQRGVTALETVLIAPALLALIFASIQFALWYYAGTVARAAASEGSQAGAVGAAGPAAASAKANAVIAGPGSGILHAGSVQTDERGGYVTVTVRGKAPSLVVGLDLGVAATSTKPLEQFSPQGRP